MSYEKYFHHAGWVNPVRTPTWILFIRIYLGIQAHNNLKFHIYS
jgi:hypothetical protein